MFLQASASEFAQSNRLSVRRLILLLAFIGLAGAVMAAAPSRPQQLTSPDQVPEGLAKSDWSSIRAAYEAGRHAFQPTATGWQARNPGQQWTTTFDRRGFVATPQAGGWTWGLELQGYGFGAHQQTIAGIPAVQAEGSRLTYQWDHAVQEWFVNDQRGLEHGFTVSTRPAADAAALTAPDAQPTALSFLLAVRGGLRPHVTPDALGVEFRDAAGATVLNYAGLKVWDADGKILTSHFEQAESPPAAAGTSHAFRLLVDERGARYPITIDPIAQQAYLKASNAEAFDSFGFSVAIDGDTVVVGAYGEDSDSTGVNGTPSNNSAALAGAAYVFVRSAGAWTQQAYLKASNTEAFDFFGYSVAIDGDTVVVGAYGEDSDSTGVNGTTSTSYTLTVTIGTPTITAPPTASGITYGQTLAASTLSGGTASAAGTFTFTTTSTAPGAGTAAQGVTFTPTDTTNYTSTTTTVNVTVAKATPTISAAPTASGITYGQTLASSTLSGGTASVAGTFAYTTSSTAPNAGTAAQSMTFTPTSTANYNVATTTVNVTVAKATPTVTWATPSAIAFGTALSATQLNATANVAGSFIYTPASGTVLAAGIQSLSVGFTPTDAANYNAGSATTVSLTAGQASQTITFGALAGKIYGDVAFTLSATASSDLTVTYLSSNTAVATVSGNTVTIVGAGTTTITASQAGATNYSAATSVSQTLTVTLASPAITTQPGSQTVTAGNSAAFSVGATSSAPLAYQWRKGGTAIGGATNATYTIAGTVAADAGDYDVVVSNAAGSVTSLVASLVVAPATVPVILIQPVSQSSTGPGGTVTFVVAATGSPAPTFQWYFNGVAILAATSAELTLNNVQASAAGNYTVAATNSAGTVKSSIATFTLTQPGNSAAHAVVGSGYVAGRTVTLTNTLTYSGTATALSWAVLLPTGWSFAASAGSAGDQGPLVGQTSELYWAWTNIPQSPVSFTYTLNVPAGQAGLPELVALVGVRNGTSLQFLATPDPLGVPPVMTHGADTDQNYQMSLVELTRVIELFNTFNGTVRTGAYVVTASAGALQTEDGFAADPSRLSTAAVTLSAYHSADSDRDGKINLVELTRVIELYNYRTGTNRTGAYHVQTGTEDGFEPGP